MARHRDRCPHQRHTSGLDKVDKVWQPMESLYPPGKQPIPSWFAGTPAENAQDKANELVLPEGRRP